MDKSQQNVGNRIFLAGIMHRKRSPGLNSGPLLRACVFLQESRISMTLVMTKENER